MQVNLDTEVQAKNQLAKRLSGHPDVQEYHHTLSPGEPTDLTSSLSFVELTVRNEGFKPQPHSLDDIIHF